MAERTFIASWDGECMSCGGDFEAGDDVGYRYDELRCAECCTVVDLEDADVCTGDDCECNVPLVPENGASTP